MPDRAMTVPPTPPTSTFLRPAIGLLAGIGVSLLVIFIGTVIAGAFTLRGADALTRDFPASYVRGKLIAAALGAFAGGFTTSRITAGRSMYTVLVLALILFVAVARLIVRGSAAFPNDPAWFPLTLAVVELAFVIAGGLVERRIERSGTP